MQTLNNAEAGNIVLAMAERIIENRAYLSEIDGKIGDGDHGVNMAKGFNLAAERLKGKNASLSGSLDTLGTVLMTEIGGSMGPLYGVMFTEFAEKIDGVDATSWRAMEEATNKIDALLLEARRLGEQERDLRNESDAATKDVATSLANTAA